MAAVVLALIAVWVGAPVALALTGRYVIGQVRLTPTALIYRAGGLQTTVPWDHVQLAVDDPTRAHVAVGPVAGTTIKHQFRAGPFRGERSPGPSMAILSTRGLPLSPGQLAEVIRHYTRHPQARVELGAPASLSTIAVLAG